MKLSPLETISMRGHILFSGENKENISKCRLLNAIKRLMQKYVRLTDTRINEKVYREIDQSVYEKKTCTSTSHN